MFLIWRSGGMPQFFMVTLKMQSISNYLISLNLMVCSLRSELIMLTYSSLLLLLVLFFNMLGNTIVQSKFPRKDPTLPHSAKKLPKRWKTGKHQIYPNQTIWLGNLLHMWPIQGPYSFFLDLCEKGDLPPEFPLFLCPLQFLLSIKNDEGYRKVRISRKHLRLRSI